MKQNFNLKFSQWSFKKASKTVNLSKKSSNYALSWLIPILFQIWDIILDLSVIKNDLFDIAGNGRLMGNNNIFCALVDVNFTPEIWVIWSTKNRSAQVVLEAQLMRKKSQKVP